MTATDALDEDAAMSTRGEDLLANPTLLAALASHTSPTTVYEAVDAAWNAFLTDATDERWHSFSNVLVAANSAGMSSEHIIEFGRKWAVKVPQNKNGMPSDAVVDMLVPHVRAAGLIQ